MNEALWLPAVVTFSEASSLGAAPCVSASGVSLWLASTAREAGALSLEHGRVRPCLPLRATGKITESAAAAWMEARASDALEALTNLGDHAEFVFAFSNRETPPSTSSLREIGYLKAVAAARRAQDVYREGFLARLKTHETLLPSAFERRWVVSGTNRVDLSFLAPRDAKRDVVALCEAFGEAVGAAADIFGSGPWPAYSFAALPDRFEEAR